MRHKRYDISDDLLDQEKHHVQSDVSITEIIHNNEEAVEHDETYNTILVGLSININYRKASFQVERGCRKKEM
jgi:hypothetical protein